MVKRYQDFNKPVMEEPEDPQQISKINSAGLINLRISNLWMDAHRHSRDAKYIQWNEDLDRIWTELAGDTEAGGEEEKKFTELNLTLAKSFEGSIPATNKGFEEVHPIQKVSLIKQKQALMNKEIFLRRLQNKQGKGTAYRDDDEDDWD